MHNYGLEDNYTTAKKENFPIFQVSQRRITQYFKNKIGEQKANISYRTALVSCGTQKSQMRYLCNFEPKPQAFTPYVQLQFSNETCINLLESILGVKFAPDVKDRKV